MTPPPLVLTKMMQRSSSIFLPDKRRCPQGSSLLAEYVHPDIVIGLDSVLELMVESVEGAFLLQSSRPLFLPLPPPFAANFPVFMKVRHSLPTRVEKFNEPILRNWIVMMVIRMVVVVVAVAPRWKRQVVVVGLFFRLRGDI